MLDGCPSDVYSPLTALTPHTTEHKMTTTTITNAQIAALATEAATAGDTAMAATCTRALAGSARARAVCARAIRAAAARV